ncbi:putative CRAL-TRIO lipid binding domain-containing protein [Helianthus annuus]|nr:putative CRAL-TRIO lipid binding domain-containing protein [Helianthus annuus]KAJ0468560.1 putative CRAL-TRIO lipid binding domain-containing protein [Helianthus annuus]
MAQQPPPDHIKLIHNLNLFKIKGRDKRDRKILKIIGKHFPAKSLNADLLKKYLEVKVFPKLERPFVVVYVHTDVCKSENFPGFSVLRTVYHAIPINVKQNLEWVYFVHPDLQSRVFLATFGRFIFSGGLYAKLKFVSRLSYLWNHVKRNEIEIPEFVYDHDDDLEYRPMMDYGIESDHPRVYDAPPVSTYSMRCIS